MLAHKKRVKGRRPLRRWRGAEPLPGFGQSPNVPLRLSHVNDVGNSTRCMQMEATYTHVLYAKVSQPLPYAVCITILSDTGSAAVSGQLVAAVFRFFEPEKALMFRLGFAQTQEGFSPSTSGGASPRPPFFIPGPPFIFSLARDAAPCLLRLFVV